MKILAIDTETTGLDFYSTTTVNHNPSQSSSKPSPSYSMTYYGARPFFITSCNEKQEQTSWIFNVNPITREVSYPSCDVEHIAETLDSADVVVGHNFKFDAHALSIIHPRLQESVTRLFKEDRVEDTLVAGHILASLLPHNLTDTTLHYLGVDIEPYERKLKAAVESARRLARKFTDRVMVEEVVNSSPPFDRITPVSRGVSSITRKRKRYLPWRLAKEGQPEMPSAKGGKTETEKKRGTNSSTPWRADYWLPRAVAVRSNYSLDHSWYTVLSRYANADSSATIGLWVGARSYSGMRDELEKRGLWKIYRERMKLVWIAFRMEQRGLWGSLDRSKEIEDEFRPLARTYANTCVNIAEQEYNYHLVMPNGTSPNDSLRGFFYGQEGMNLLHPPKTDKKKKTDAPSLDKHALAHFELTLPGNTPQGLFVRSLIKKRKIDSSLSYLAGYKRFGVSVPSLSSEEKNGNWVVVHPSLNPCGTDTLRWSSSNPNAQNIEVDRESGHTLRYFFGPGPGREWYSVDGQNLELRIPSFRAPEPLLIEVFNNPDKPPYFGSYHAVIFDVLFPDLFRRYGAEGIKEHCLGIYKRVKNFDFALIYGAQKEKADLTVGLEGAYEIVSGRFPNIARLGKIALQQATRLGYIEVFPDASIDPEHGYPLMIQRTQYGKPEPTKPLNYLIQGAACQWKNRALVRCSNQLDIWREVDQFDGHIALEVHDEIDFDFPMSYSSPLEDLKWEKEHGRAPTNKDGKLVSNLWRIRVMQRLMEQGGVDIGVPTPTSCKYHPVNWETGTKL